MKGPSLVRAERSHRYWQVGFWFVVIVLVVSALRWLGPVLNPVLAAFALAYLFDPLVTRLERRRLPRSVGAALVLLTITVVAIGAAAVLVPLVAEDLREFATRVPDLVERARAFLHARFGLELQDWNTLAAQAQDEIRQAAARAGVAVIGSAMGALGSVLSFLVGVLELVLVPVFAFYFLVDWPKIVARLRELTPPRHRDAVHEVVGEVDAKLSAWLHGQLAVTGILAALYAIGLSIAGIQLAIPVGILVGVLTFIPYIGTVVGLVLALAMAFVDWHGAGTIAGVLIVFGALHALEAWALTPRLVGRRVGLGEAGALFAVVAGGHVLGFMGVMLAIPLAASAMVLVKRALGYYERSQFYAQGTEHA
jgi:predicted PurR-regulated permease PerM